MTRLSRRLTLSGSGVINATAAEIAALAAASGLTPGAIYFDAATGIHYFASSSSAYAALSPTAHLGTLTVAAMLAVSSPATGMTCDLSDLGNIVSRWRYNGSFWVPQGGRQQIYSLLADTYNATADGTDRLIPNCQVGIAAGLLAYTGAGVEARFSTQKSNTAESPTVTLRLGSAGSNADAIAGGPWTITAGTYRALAQTYGWVRHSPTLMQVIGVASLNPTTPAHRFGAIVNQARPAEITVGNMDAGGATNYLSLFSTRAGAFAEYMTADTFDVFLTGR